jgi:hypothetical protein
MAAQSVQRTTADEPDQTGCHEGPTIHFDRPPAGTPPLTSSDFRCGPPAIPNAMRATRLLASRLESISALP